MLNYKTPLNAFPAPADKTCLCIYVNLRNFRKIQTHVYIENCPSAYPLYLTNINKICKIGIKRFMRKVSNGTTKRWEVEDIAYNL